VKGLGQPGERAQEVAFVEEPFAIGHVQAHQPLPALLGLVLGPVPLHALVLLGLQCILRVPRRLITGAGDAEGGDQRDRGHTDQEHGHGGEHPFRLSHHRMPPICRRPGFVRS